MGLFGKKRKDDQGEKFFTASQWQLMWWKFRKHKLAVVSLYLLVVFYIMAIFCEFFSPTLPNKRWSDYIYTPRTSVHLFDEEGKFRGLFVYSTKPGYLDEMWVRHYDTDKTRINKVRFFVRGDEYKLLGLIKSNVHLFGVEGGEPLFLLGSDRLGRDMLSRIIYGSRISLSIGLVGVAISFLLGCLIGGISGFFGGIVDQIIQRIIETLLCIPSLPLWMGLAAALPARWPPTMVYFGIVVILSLIGWTGMARVVRGKIISLREEDFAMAARLAGATEMWTIRRHLLPSFYSYIIVSLTLSVPGMILGETALSYIGIGLRPPAVSWGVLLQQAQNIQVVAQYPWIMSPGIFVIVVVLAFNFVGDGMRDAADPYTR